MRALMDAYRAAHTACCPRVDQDGAPDGLHCYYYGPLSSPQGASGTMAYSSSLHEIHACHVVDLLCLCESALLLLLQGTPLSKAGAP
jgi:hypothetical protein